MIKWRTSGVKRKPKVDTVNKIYSACFYGKIGQQGSWVTRFMKPWTYMVLANVNFRVGIYVLDYLPIWWYLNHQTLFPHYLHIYLIICMKNIAQFILLKRWVHCPTNNRLHEREYYRFLDICNYSNPPTRVQLNPMKCPNHIGLSFDRVTLHGVEIVLMTFKTVLFSR